MTAIEENKDLDDIKVQELVGFLQTYEMSLLNQRKSKSLALKTINEKVEDKTHREKMWLTKMLLTLSKILESS